MVSNTQACQMQVLSHVSLRFQHVGGRLEKRVAPAFRPVRLCAPAQQTPTALSHSRRSRDVRVEPRVMDGEQEWLVEQRGQW